MSSVFKVPIPSRPHPHLYTHITYSTCMHMNRLDSHQRICITLKLLLAFHFAAPQAPRAHTFRCLIQMQTSRQSLWWIAVCQPFISVANQLGFAELKHLIEARKVTDYWIVTYCIEGCLLLHCRCVAILAYENNSTIALSITWVLNYGHFIAKKNTLLSILTCSEKLCPALQKAFNHIWISHLLLKFNDRLINK